jgi:release factor glutamine methyltransferase
MSEISHELLAELEATLARASVADAAGEALTIIGAAQRQTAAGDYAKRARDLAIARARGTPLAHLTTQASFMGVDVFVAPGALIPRDETELLGRSALDVLKTLPSEPRLIDMCCGSGNLAVGIASNHATVRVWASDLTDGAVGVARTNVDRLGLADRIDVRQGDLFAPLAGCGLEGTMDVVVCNPPYVSTGKLGKERAFLLDHEPREAFDGGPYGISIFQRVVRDATSFLKPGGHLLFEFGVGQEKQVTLLLARTNRYDSPVVVRDSAREPRVLVARMK